MKRNKNLKHKTNPNKDDIKKKEEKLSKKWDSSIGMSNGFAPLIEMKKFKGSNPNGFYFTQIPNSAIFNLNINGYGIVYSSFPAIFS